MEIPWGCQGVCTAFTAQGVGAFVGFEIRNGNFQSPHIFPFIMWGFTKGVATNLTLQGVRAFVGFGDPNFKVPTYPMVGGGALPWLLHTRPMTSSKATTRSLRPHALVNQNSCCCPPLPSGRVYGWETCESISLNPSWSMKLTFVWWQAAIRERERGGKMERERERERDRREEREQARERERQRQRELKKYISFLFSTASAVSTLST